MSTYTDKRNGQLRPIPNCERLGLQWDRQTQRCERSGLGFLGFGDGLDPYTGGVPYDQDYSVAPFGVAYDQDNSVAPFGGTYDQDTSGDYYNTPTQYEDPAPLAGDGTESYGDDGSYYYEDPSGGYYYEDPSGAYYGGDANGYSYGSYDGADYWESDPAGNYFWEAPDGTSYYEDNAGNWSWNDAAGNTCSGDVNGNVYCQDNTYTAAAQATRAAAQQTRQKVSGGGATAGGSTASRPQTSPVRTQQTAAPSVAPIASRNQLQSSSGDLLSNPWVLIGAAALLLVVASR